jgi:hypothetical protein
VPAPQLASPADDLGALLVFFAVDFAGAFAGAADDAGAAEALEAATALVDGVVVDAALEAGLVAPAALLAGAGSAFAPHAFAEQEAFPEAAGAAAVAGTSLALTGCGSLPPHATKALVPSKARTAVRFSIDRLGRMGSLLRMCSD